MAVLLLAIVSEAGQARLAHPILTLEAGVRVQAKLDVRHARVRLLQAFVNIWASWDATAWWRGMRMRNGIDGLGVVKSRTAWISSDKSGIYGDEEDDDADDEVYDGRRGTRDDNMCTTN